MSFQVKNFILLIVLLQIPLCFAQETKNKRLNLNELALPSEVKNLNKQSGAIYYSPSIKKKVLIPVHFWGEVTNTGLHFIPVDTNFIKGLSLAGGPNSNADLEKVVITRTEDNKKRTITFDLTKGGSDAAQNFVFKTGDVVFLKRDRYFENRTYYTGLVAVATTFLTGILLYNQVKDL